MIAAIVLLALCLTGKVYTQYYDEMEIEEDLEGYYTRVNTAPRSKFLAIWPAGMKIVVRDDGYSLVTFHGNLNKAIQGHDTGYWSKDMRKNKNGKWIFKDKNVELKIGDKIHFWIYVTKNGKGYRHDGEWIVNKYIDENGQIVNSGTSDEMQAPTAQQSGIKDPLCQTSQTLVLGMNVICKNTLIFSEEFSKKTIKELSNWQPESKFPEEPDYPFNVYMTEPEGVMKVEDGALVISPVLLEDYKYEGFIHESLDLTNRCTGQAATTECKREASGAYILPPVITGKLTSKHQFCFKYGRVEIRAKLPAGNWLLPEINLEPHQNVYGTHRYESGLMRVAFAKGNDVFAKKLYGGPVLTDTDPYRSKLLQQKIGLENWNREYHNYTLIWRPDGLDLFVDGEPYGTVSPGEGFHSSAKENGVPHAGNWLKGSVMAPLDQMFYISLGLRVGGINDFQDETEKPWRNKSNKATVAFYNKKDEWLSTWYDPALKVDYVRVYSL